MGCGLGKCDKAKQFSLSVECEGRYTRRCTHASVIPFTNGAQNMAGAARPFFVMPRLLFPVALRSTDSFLQPLTQMLDPALVGAVANPLRLVKQFVILLQKNYIHRDLPFRN